MLTARQLAACKRVLAMFLESRCASIVLTLTGDDLDMFIALGRSGRFLRTIEARTSGPFRWDRIVATDEGRHWLQQTTEEDAMKRN